MISFSQVCSRQMKLEGTGLPQTHQTQNPEDAEISDRCWKPCFFSSIFRSTDPTHPPGKASSGGSAAAAKSLQSCPTLCDPIDGSPLGSSVPGILRARILEWVTISFSNAWKWKVKVKSLSRARLLATPWAAAYQAPPSMGFSRQEYWSGVPLHGGSGSCFFVALFSSHEGSLPWPV